MYELKVDREIHGPSVLVRWCLDPETTSLLKDHAEAKPQILLVIAGPHNSETRVLTPLENVMQYVEVRRPGPNTILSAIVWRGPYSDHAPQSTYLRRVHGRYWTDLVARGDVEQEDPQIRSFLSVSGEYGMYGIVGPTLQIDVPKEVFAKEPPKWEQKWVNWLFSHAPVDQCAYRRRRIFAYSLKPFLGLGYLAFLALYLFFCVGVATLVLLAAGFYQIRFREAVAEIRYGLSLIKPEVLWQDAHRSTNYWRWIWQKLFSAAPKRENLGKREEEDRKAQQRKERQEEQERQRLLRLYQSLACTTETSSQPRPPTKQRVYLFVHDIKALVCKPFAG